MTVQISKKKLILLYCIVQSGYWFSGCTIFGFSTLFFLHRGFSASQIGMIVALGGLLGVVAQPVFSGIVDKGKMKLHTILKILGTILAVLMLSLIFITSRKMIIVVVFLAADTLIWSIMSLVNSVSVYYINRGVFLDFGIARGFGSVAYAIALFALGGLIERFSISVIMISGILGLLALVISVMMMPVLDRKEQENKTQTSKKAKENNQADTFLVFVKKYKRFMIVLFGVALLFTSHNMNVAYGINIVQRFGGDSSQLGIAFSAAVRFSFTWSSFLILAPMR